MTYRGFLLVVLACSSFSQSARKPATKGEALGPYYPTPETVVDKMLEVAGVRPGEVVYDLGSGDGRIVIQAARKFKARAVGVEFEEKLVEKSRATIRSFGLEKTARIIHGDVLAQDYSDAGVVTVYLLPVGNEKLTPILERSLKKGARVVAHDFEFKQWKPVKIETMVAEDEDVEHTIYLYQR